MKSIFAVSFFVTLLFAAGTAFSYQCDIPAPPPQDQPCSCSPCQKKQCKKPQCRQHCHSGRCGTYDKCKCHRCAQKKPCSKQVVHKDSYQCKTTKTTCTTTTEQIDMVQCRLCGTRYPKGVDHYCNKVACRSCGQMHPKGADHRCGMIQCKKCGRHHPHGMRHHCGEIRCQACGVHYHPQTGHHCKAPCQHQDCPQAAPSRTQEKQCSKQEVSLTQKDTRETRWHAWFKNKG